MNQSVPDSEELAQNQTNDKEYNFGLIRKQLEQERFARQQAEDRALQAERLVQSKNITLDEDDDSEPYVDHKKLNKKLNEFGEQSKQETASIIQQEVHKALSEERKQNWIRNNPDFNKVMDPAIIKKFADADPELAETILQMPEGFERQKLVYRNIKSLGLDKPEVKSQSIQEKIDANRRSPYYQPSGVGTSPYQTQGDFSESGKEQAFNKMREVQKRIRL